MITTRDLGHGAPHHTCRQTPRFSSDRNSRRRRGPGRPTAASPLLPVPAQILPASPPADSPANKHETVQTDATMKITIHAILITHTAPQQTFNGRRGSKTKYDASVIFSTVMLWTAAGSRPATVTAATRSVGVQRNSIVTSTRPVVNGTPSS